MPIETQQAVDWALQQTHTDEFGGQVQVTINDSSMLVDKIREYFNMHEINYDTFSFGDLQKYNFIN